MNNNRFTPYSFQVSNFIVDDMLYKLSGNALKCYLLIVRKTLGWQKKFDAISISQFEQSLGIQDKTVRKSLKELSSLDLIRTQRSTGKPTSFYVVLSPEPSSKKGSSVNNGIEKITSSTPSKNNNTQKTLKTEEEEEIFQEFKIHLESFIKFLKQENGVSVKHPISFRNKLIANFKADDSKTLEKYEAYKISHYYVSSYVTGKYFNDKKILGTKINDDGFLCLIFNDEIMRIEKKESYRKIINSVVDKD